MARRRLLAVTAVLAVAAGTFGTGVYLNRESPTWQRILGTEPVIEVAPKATDALPVLLGETERMLATAQAPSRAKTTVALEEIRAQLREHVELLTPLALEARAAAAATASADESAAPPAAAEPLDPAGFSRQLAQAGNGLLAEALSAPGQEARRLSGAGIDLVLSARTLLAAAGAKQAELEKLPAPALVLAAGTAAESANPSGSADPSATPAPAVVPTAGPTTERAALADMPTFVVDACPVPDSGTATDTDNGTPAEADVLAGSGLLLGQVIDASYRMGYAYDVAAARTSAGLRTTAWNRSKLLVDFATSLERQLDAALDCAPLRLPAYQLSADAAANPMDAARTGENQLALLLRDAAATQSGEARAYLLNAAWAQGLFTRQVTGSTPDFTVVEETATPATQSPAAG